MAFSTRRTKKAKANDESSTQLITKSSSQNPRSTVNPYYDTFDADTNDNTNSSSNKNTSKQKLKLSKLKINRSKSHKSTSALSPIVSAPEDNNTLTPMTYIQPVYSTPVTPTAPNKLTPKLESRPTGPYDPPVSPPPKQYGIVPLIILAHSMDIPNITF